MNIKSKINLTNIAILASIPIIFGIVFWYWKNSSFTSISKTSKDQKITEISLGSQILLRTQDIIRDKFPETNPLKQIIKNPF